MKSRIRKSSFSMKFTVVSIFLFLSIVTVALALSLQYYFSQSLAKEAADQQFQQVSEKVSERVHALDAESLGLAELLAAFPQIETSPKLAQLHPATHVMAKSMQLKQYLYAIYIGYKNGDIYELINLDNNNQLKGALEANENDRWLVMKILNTDEGRKRIYEYYDDAFKMRERHEESSSFYAYDRPWYRQALQENKVIKTSPYLFHHTQSPGVTYARPIADSGHVIAIDIALSTLSNFLKQQSFLPSSEAMIFGEDGTLAAHSFNVSSHNLSSSTKHIKLTEQEQAYIKELGTLRVSNELNWPPFDYSYGGKPLGYSIDLVNLLAQKSGIDIEYSNGYEWFELLDLFHQRKLDLVHSIYHSEEREDWGVFTKPYRRHTSAFVTPKGTADIEQISDLNGKTVAIPKGWYLEEYIQTSFPQITILSVDNSLDALKAVSNGSAYAAIETEDVISYLTRTYFLDELKINPELEELNRAASLTLNIMVHDDRPMLRDILNRAIDAITFNEFERLDQKWLKTNSDNGVLQSISAGVVPNKTLIELAEQSLLVGSAQQTMELNGQTYLGYVSRIDSIFGSGELLGILVPHDEVMAPYMKRVNFSVLLTLAFLTLLMPLMFYFAEMIVRPVNALAKENEKIKNRDFKAVQNVPSNITELIELSDSITSMAGAIEAYQLSQQELMDSFIRAIAQAIDEKSHYTAGHCERVPELAVMLAEATSNSQQEAFKSFKISSDSEWREFKIAAWLHDCGKVTTPEHIVDKGSKLETIYNRIHEVRTRFEVLWRDAEIAYWRGLANGQPEAQLKLALCQRIEQIQDDFTFIANSNVGSEFMEDEQIARIKAIGSQTWVRHLDDRLGLSPEESRRLGTHSKPLPATENLLADTPEHLIQWPKRPDNRSDLGIMLKVPEYEANQGEIYNLTIRKGTLTDEERFRINEHVTATIKMLDELPLPDDLSRVPEYAGNHHETLVGTGYPRGLDSSQLSIPSRILAVADVFEALTAGDRPYKNGKTLSQSIRILNFMAKDQYLDMDLVKLLLSSGIFQRYAQKYLNPEQIDEVDLAAYLSDDDQETPPRYQAKTAPSKQPDTTV